MLLLIVFLMKWSSFTFAKIMINKCELCKPVTLCFSTKHLNLRS